MTHSGNWAIHSETSCGLKNGCYLFGKSRTRPARFTRITTPVHGFNANMLLPTMPAARNIPLIVFSCIYGDDSKLPRQVLGGMVAPRFREGQ
jgi:hypothetical protein